MTALIDLGGFALITQNSALFLIVKMTGTSSAAVLHHCARVYGGESGIQKYKN